MSHEPIDAGALFDAAAGDGARARRSAQVRVHGPVQTVAAACERVLRSLPGWFSVEDSLLTYARNSAQQLTFVAELDGQLVGFMSLVPGPDGAWELDCLAVEAPWRGRGLGRRLQRRAEAWLAERGALAMQVKTLAESHPSPEYAQTRAFYEAVGYIAEADDGGGWGLHLPVVQMVKPLGPFAEPADAPH